jgi:hypothetical protein
MTQPENKRKRLPKDLSERLSTEAWLGDMQCSLYCSTRGLNTLVEKLKVIRNMEDKYLHKQWDSYCTSCHILCNIDTHVCAYCQDKLDKHKCCKCGPISRFAHHFQPSTDFMTGVRLGHQPYVHSPAPCLADGYTHYYQ